MIPLPNTGLPLITLCFLKKVGMIAIHGSRFTLRKIYIRLILFLCCSIITNWRHLPYSDYYFTRTGNDVVTDAIYAPK
jgi:hypothetical protein